MPRYKLRTLLIVVGIPLLLFGLGCLNYTKTRGLEHHQAFARQHGLPEPSERILLSGVVCLVVGAGAIGYAIGASGRRGDGK
jgi:hypothetical protein